MVKRTLTAVLISGALAGAGASAAEATTRTGPWRCVSNVTRGGCHAHQNKLDTISGSTMCLVSVRSGYLGAAGPVNVGRWTPIYKKVCMMVTL